MRIAKSRTKAFRLLILLTATVGLSVFPAQPAPPPRNITDAVPTEVERGPDGALYVSLLTGVPFTAGLP